MIRIERVLETSQQMIDTLNKLLPQLGVDYVMNQTLLQKIVESEDIYLLVAKEADEIVGTLTLALYPIPTGLRSWIEDVVVDENHRGKGIARLLVGKAVELSKERGVVSLSLSSSPERIGANKLYQSIGFKLRITNFYRYNTDE